MLKKESWSNVAIIATVISEVLIISTWNDAKFGTVANIIISIVAIAGWASMNFEAHFINDAKANLLRTNSIKSHLLTEPDIQLLRLPVQKYLRYCGVVNKPKAKNMRIVFNGEMRDKGKPFFKLCLFSIIFLIPLPGYFL